MHSLLLLTLFFLSWVPFSKAANLTPNIILIISDDQAWTDYGFMGHPRINTPNLDRLAQRSLLFKRGYVPSSLCCPSLASIITGRYPHQHKVVCNDPPVPAGLSRSEYYKSDAFRAGRDRLSSYIENTPTLPRELKKRGYLSFQSGKWWQNHYSRGGFTHGMTTGEETRGGRHGDSGLEIGRKTLQPIYGFINMAVAANKPFFVWYAPMLPHDPHTPPQRLLDKYLALAPSIHVARYWAMIEWFDETCGDLLRFLDQKDLTQNTIIAFVADNGWIQSLDNPRFAPRSKQSPYDGGLRTPILLSCPGKIQPGTSETPVSSIDLIPTLLRLAGLQTPSDLLGCDLLDPNSLEKRTAIFGACFTHDCIDLENPAISLRWRWAVSRSWKLILPAPQNEAGGPELYNLFEDPFEKTNLASNEPAIVARIQHLLDGWWPGKQ